MSEGMIQICRNADFLWYWGHYPAQNGLTHMDANFNTNNTPLPTEASSSLGRAANSEEWDAWMNTGRHRFGTAWQDGRMDMICASNAWLNREITVTESETREQDRSIQRTGVAYLSADIAPGIDFSGDIGDVARQT
ncbi:hypothetical protein [Nesterenkonia alba]|uniref:hypothetical protein n=1 Tax=Nesterenkonia alba TaxID=515814 RepID=UPI0012EB57CA|nr:hypothetical protein [Nesterenkonia alba]